MNPSRRASDAISTHAIKSHPVLLDKSVRLMLSVR